MKKIIVALAMVAASMFVASPALADQPVDPGSSAKKSQADPAPPQDLPPSAKKSQDDPVPPAPAVDSLAAPPAPAADPPADPQGVESQAVESKETAKSESKETAKSEHDPPPHDKVTLCHATGSESNPFVLITVSAAAAFNGHLDHQHGEDIIPPFEFQGNEYSQNWEGDGQQIFDDCEPAENGHDDDDDESDDDEGDDEKSNVAKSSSADTLPDTGGSSMVLIPLGSLLVLAGSMLVGRRKAEEL